MGVDSNKSQPGCRMIYAGSPAFFGLPLEGGHVPSFWLLLDIEPTQGEPTDY